MYGREYSKPSIASSGCSYARLGGYKGIPNLIPDTQQAMTRPADVVVVPTYGSVGYSALTNKQPSCSGYFTVGSAYACNTPSSSWRMCG